MRISTVAFQGVAHCTTDECRVELDDGTEYIIPKGQSCIPNNEYIHIYAENEDFKNNGDVNGGKICLENFLDDDGSFAMNKSFIGFGVGRRGWFHFVYISWFTTLDITFVYK